jgi:hypothetical protein
MHLRRFRWWMLLLLTVAARGDNAVRIDPAQGRLLRFTRPFRAGRFHPQAW